MTNIKELKAQYEKDVTDHGREKANSMWEYEQYGGWTTFYTTEVPIWYTNVEYRRKRSAYLAKPQGHKHAELMAQYAEDALTHEKPWTQWEAYCTKPPRNWFALKSHPSWADDHDYRRKPKPKTNSQVACELLGKAYAALEEHSAEICEPNVDHIQRLVWDAMELIQPEDKPAPQHTIVLTDEQLKEVILACELVGWENEDFLSAERILTNALKGE
jgi:hypothetical protein